MEIHQSRTEIPKDLIEELKNPERRKRSIKTILRENWPLVEDVDKQLKLAEIPADSPILVVFLLQNFLHLMTLIVNPRSRKRKIRSESAEVQKFENDLRDAQKNWPHFFKTYEETIDSFVKIGEQKVDFRRNLWQKTRIQKITAEIVNFTRNLETKTVHFVPPTRFIFNLIGFLASWTLLPISRLPRKLTGWTGKAENFKSESPRSAANGHYPNGHIAQNGRNHAAHSRENHVAWKPPAAETDESLLKFHAEIEETGRFLTEKEREWNFRSSQFQKEIRARLEVQEKRLSAEIEHFEEEKEARRRQEEEEFRRRMEQQDVDFQTIIGKIEEERKTLEEEELEKLLETFERQDEALLSVLEHQLTMKACRKCEWEEHEEFWADRLQILRNSLTAIRSQFWNFEGYLKQYLEADFSETSLHFGQTVYKMEATSFGRTVTRAQTLLTGEQEFLESLLGKYQHDVFLRVLMNLLAKTKSQLDRVILELWNISIDSDGYDESQIRTCVLQIDPYCIPTAWRLKGICHSVDPRYVYT